MIDVKKIQSLFSSPKITSLDKKIFKLLKEKVPPQVIFKEIRNHSDTEGVSKFLFNSGLYKALIIYSLKLLKDKKEVSWHYVIKVFIKHNLYPSEKDIMKTFFHSFLKHKPHYSLFACEQWGKLSPEFQQMSDVFLDKLEALNISEEKKLLEQLAFVKAKDMIKDEEEIIAQLITINPANQDYRDLQKDLDEKKALLVISDYKKSQKHKPTQWLSSNERVMSKKWEDKILEMSENQPSCTKALSLFSCFANNVKLAFRLLEKYIEKPFSQPEDCWYYIDWALRTKQFTKGLNVINQIEKRKEFYHFDSVELLYKKAQFLYGLGKEDEAIEHLHSITQLYPDYKNSQYLLSQWSKNA